MKIVITGGPCSGKTTIINELKKRGYFTMDEVARHIITKKKYSKNLDTYEGEALKLQLEIYNRQIEKEKDLDKADDVYPNIVFLDRGCIDTLAYCRHLLGHIPKEITHVPTKRYDAILLLERLPLVDDGLRRETDKEAIKLHQEIIQEYIDAGYVPITIPVKSVKERIKSILDIVNAIENKTSYQTICDKISINI